MFVLSISSIALLLNGSIVIICRVGESGFTELEGFTGFLFAGYLLENKKKFNIHPVYPKIL